MRLRRVLITGANGFVGRHTAAALAAAGAPLTLLVRREGAAMPAWREFPDVRIIVGELGSAELDAVLRDAEAVVHAAGNPRADAEAGAQSAEIEAAEQLAATAQAAGVTTFVFLSSIFAVTANSTRAHISDATPDAPASAYGRSKLEAERRIAANTGMLTVSLRPPLVIGSDAGGNWRGLMGLAVSGLPLPFGSLAARRSYLPVADLVAAIVRLVTQEWPGSLSGAYAVTGSAPASLPQVLGALRDGMGLPRRLFGVPPEAFTALGALTGRQQMIASLTGSLEVDGSRFARTFGFEPSPLLPAIEEIGRAFKAQRGSPA